MARNHVKEWSKHVKTDSSFMAYPMQALGLREGSTSTMPLRICVRFTFFRARLAAYTHKEETSWKRSAKARVWTSQKQRITLL